ncbi:MAG: hypothetical protein FWH14_08030 [Oscillospiraceae bacterium]|nr:hypothetical protein [Oscillospiraceae bacterium]
MATLVAAMVLMSMVAGCGYVDPDLYDPDDDDDDRGAFEIVYVDPVDLVFEHTPTMDENFEDDTVLVTFYNRYSEVNKEYTPEYFNIPHEGIRFESVTDLTYVNSDRVVDMDRFTQILSLKLKTPGKENVIRAVALLKQHEKLKFAQPNYIYDIEYDI